MSLIIEGLVNQYSGVEQSDGILERVFAGIPGEQLKIWRDELKELKKGDDRCTVLFEHLDAIVG